METTEFWLLSRDRNTLLRLPVNPASNSYTSPFKFTDTEVEGLGEVTTIGRRGLKEFTISTFWPRDYNPVYCSYSRFVTPQQFVDYIEAWRDSRKPIRFVVTGAGGVNLPVTIREFQIEAERAGSPGDVYFTLVLKEWREKKVAVLDTSAPEQSQVTEERPTAPEPEPAKSYTVKKNDSLWKISKQMYGEGSQWRRIYDANADIIGKNPDLIYPGQVLVIPQ